MKLLIVTFFVSSSLLIAQSRNVQIEEMKIPQPNNPVTINTSFVPNQPNSPGEEFLVTGYDYMTNNATRQMIDLIDLDGDGFLDPIMVAMERLGDPTGNRLIYFGYKAFGVIGKWIGLDPAHNDQGWPEIQVCVGGPFDGNALLMGTYAGECWYAVQDLIYFQPQLPFPTTTFGRGAPSFVYTPDAIYTTSSDKIIRKSTDAGQTFYDLLMIGDGDPNVDIKNDTNSPSEIPIRKSSNGLHIYTFGIFEGAGLVGNPDIAYLYGSTDGGVTWSGSIIGVGSGLHPEYGQIVNRDYAPYFANFAQISLNVDDQGIAHITANGYGEGLYMGGTDTVNVFPMLYWNSNHQNWIAVTPESMEAPDDGFGTDLTIHRPGNGIGNSYGITSLSSDGQGIFLFWQGPEYTGAIGNSPINLFPGDGGATSHPIFWTDIYYTFSENGGSTWWNRTEILQGDANVMESFPVLAPRLEIEGYSTTAHFLYLEDAIPGVSLFSENSWSDESIWRYHRWSYTIFVGVEDENVVQRFNLEQNFPNPFNPSTKIKYHIADAGFVRLKVYDVLGNEVITLINKEMQAGIYEVEFSAIGGSAFGGDAWNLSSGIYFYTLNAGEFAQTRKMILLK